MTSFVEEAATNDYAVMIFANAASISQVKIISFIILLKTKPLIQSCKVVIANFINDLTTKIFFDECHPCVCDIMRVLSYAQIAFS